MPVSRAGAKLEAALSQFALAGAVAGARAVDVGASAGGFTEVLLAHGAASVLAVDVGRDQLHPSLRGDARVTVLEETDWRHLSLNEAEGPFDFFTVDVSFVSARNMLRGLAFRLRPGAQGVVLVKPQFELPDRQVKGGEVRDQNLRQAAVDRVRKRGEALGFQLVADVDSPVAGREGSIEILAHLTFEGRSERLPAPGERRPHQPRARRKAAGPEALRWFAVVAPGLEPAAEHEVRALEGATDVTAVAGGVEWTAPALGGLEANLWLRTVTRVLARVGSVEAREFGKLRRRAAGLPWDRFLARGAVVSIRASATRSRLYHTGALVETAALAIADAVPGVRVATKDQDEPAAAVLVRGEADRFTFSVDASGERLHRRGARIEVGAAPMRETLAAGLLALAGWDPEPATLRSRLWRRHDRDRGGAASCRSRAGAGSRVRAGGLAAVRGIRRARGRAARAGACARAADRAGAHRRVRSRSGGDRERRPERRARGRGRTDRVRLPRPRRRASVRRTKAAW